MKKINMMPITIVSLYFSYTVVIFGLVTSMWLLIFKFSGLKSVLLSFSILIASLFLAILLRVFGNIGQILFDLKNLISKDLENLSQQMQSFRKSLEEAIEKSDSSARDGLQNQNQELIAQIQSFRKSLEAKIENLSKESDHSVLEGLQNLKNSLEQINCDSKESDHSVLEGLQNIKTNLEQINCDSKDINQYIHQIQIFFEQIARHLELKK